MSVEILQARLDEIELELNDNTQKYLENCKSNYSEYVQASQVLFPEVYKQIELYNEKYDLLDYLTEYNQANQNNDLETQISILQTVIQNGIYTPATYEMLAKAYEKKKDLEAAIKVCLVWFETDFWKLPNTCNGSLKILKRLDRLEKKNKA